METRTEILDRLSKKYSQKTHPFVENFKDFCTFFNSDAITSLVRIAMVEYARQEEDFHISKRIERVLNSIEDDVLDEELKNKWSHCFLDGKQFQNPTNLQEIVKNRIFGAKLALDKIKKSR